eukprot:CAMPEP_0206399386 /NCGR_PEP_ID=MMETSP0294-20121207/24798_1 /ASSEMBLY_ACC=CAM_ASM_000327 /TAXON_ID=39354 /ORGANISM="Heterosigma akashiwo, Strain CCMP2393" /LENGTH=655 /DNA_ID=CAMNT_0053855195 /DNA_START=476 /DNA_END=2447 /DNA_ORIENTATION=+
MTGSGASTDDRIILQEFPGGPGVFKEVMRFCYFDEDFEVNPTNFAGLYYAAEYFNMDGEGNLLSLVRGWWESPDSEELFDLCLRAADIEMNCGMPPEVSLKCYRRALSEVGLDETEEIAKALSRKDHKFLALLLHIDQEHRLSASDSHCEAMSEKKRSYWQVRGAAANLFAEIFLQQKESSGESKVNDGDLEISLESAPIVTTALFNDSSKTHSHETPALQAQAQSGCPPLSAGGVYSNGLDYACMAPKLAYEIMKKEATGLEHEKLQVLTKIFEGFNTSTCVPMEVSGYLKKLNAVNSYTAIKFGLWLLKFAKHCNSQNEALFGENGSTASLLFNSMESAITMLIRTLGAVVGEFDHPFYDLAMDYFDDDVMGHPGMDWDPIGKIIHAIKEEFPFDEELHHDIEVDNLMKDLIYTFKADVSQHLTTLTSFHTYIHVVPNPSWSPFSSHQKIGSYSKGQGPDSACSRVNMRQILVKFEYWDNITYFTHELVQSLTEVGFNVNELLVVAIASECPDIAGVLLQEGANPNFQIHHTLAENESFVGPKNDLLGCTALHVLFLQKFFHSDYHERPDIGPDWRITCFEKDTVTTLISMLIGAGADVGAVNSSGRTALQEFERVLEERRAHEGLVPSDECIFATKKLLQPRASGVGRKRPR